MNRFRNKFLLLAACIASVSSCVNDDLMEETGDLSLPVAASLSEQVTAMESSVAELRNDEEMAEVVKLIEEHISFIETGISWETGTLATLRLQKNLAVYEVADAGIDMWLGADYAAFYPISVAEAKAGSAAAVVERQQLRADALLSDVEAGLRTDNDPEVLKTLACDLEKNLEEVQSLCASLSEQAAEVEDGYADAVKGASELNGSELKSLNSNAMAAASDADNTLNGLIARIKECDRRLDDIAQRLGALEEDVKDLSQLLDMIQSVTFMSEYSEEKVVAYYNLDLEKRDDQNRAARVPAGTVELNYIVRPASAAAALTEESLWNNGLEVFGYYADKIQTKAVSAENMIDFEITGVTAQPESGIVTVMVKNSLKNEFFMKETGAKLALSLTTGKTDMTSKFVEIVPKDQSGVVYLESLSLSSGYLEIDNGKTKSLTAKVSPSDVTEPGLVWTTSKDDIVTVSSEGVLTARNVGDAVITVTTKGTNEWGQTLSAQCSVKVIPSIRLSGPAYVEQGETIEINVESEDYINPDYIKWEIDGGVTAQAYASVESENGVGVVYGKAMWFDGDAKAYKPINVKCTIEGAMPVVLYHEFRVVAKQPKGIDIEGFAPGQNSVSVKRGSGVSLSASIAPAGVRTDLFRIAYQSSNTSVAKVEFDGNGWVDALAPGTAYIDVKVLDSGTHNYFYPARQNMVRQVVVSVEPYWVQTISLPETWELKVDDVATIVPEFTSDKEGVQPDDMTVTWTSDNASVVEVDPKTGQMTAKAEGTAKVTATTSGAWSVPGGSAQKSATCVVTVKKAGAADPKVGDFYYSDGTWSSELDGSKTVIGVVFSTENATGQDAKLRTDYPTATNGLVVALAEYTANHGYLSGQYTSEWLRGKGYDIFSESTILGYSLTFGLGEYRAEKGGDYARMFDKTTGVAAQHNAACAVSGSASTWYVPSFKEMHLLYENMTVVNASLSAASGTQMSTGSYWLSSFMVANKYNDLTYRSFEMSSGSWSGTQPVATKDLPVRVVLAF